MKHQGCERGGWVLGWKIEKQQSGLTKICLLGLEAGKKGEKLKCVVVGKGRLEEA